jgi:hypothetical protein
VDQILYLEDSDFCEPFAKLKAGDEVTISVEAVLANSGEMPNFENVDGKPEAKQRPFLQFVIKSVSSSSGRLLAEADDEDIERQIAEVKGFGKGFDQDELEREISAAKMGGPEGERELSPFERRSKDIAMDAETMADHEDEVPRERLSGSGAQAP